jgi:hypothetical protein
MSTYVEEFKECRYNKNHKVKEGRLYVHETNCPDKANSNLVRCSYDFNHMINKNRLEEHMKVCPKRPKIDINIHQEMLQYIIQNNAKNISSTKNSLNNKNTSDYSVNNTCKKTIAGLGLIEDKKEKKNKQKEYRQLINNSYIFNEMNNIDENENFNLNEVDNEFKADFEDSIFGKNFNESNFEIINIDDSILDCDDSKAGIQNDFYSNNQENKNKKLLFNSSKLEDDDYDPNSSDIYISKKNKNNINDSEYIYYK